MKTYSVRFEVEAESPDAALDQVCDMLNAGSSCDELYEVEWSDGTDSRLKDVTAALREVGR